MRSRLNENDGTFLPLMETWPVWRERAYSQAKDGLLFISNLSGKIPFQLGCEQQKSTHITDAQMCNV